MGGLGSTRWTLHRRRPTTGEAITLPLRALRALVEAPGPAARPASGTLRYGESTIAAAYTPLAGAALAGELAGDARGGDEGPAVRTAGTLTLTYGRGPTVDRLRLECVAQPFGGGRWWFVCRCGARRSTLYLTARQPWFRCRVCQGLAHHSQRLAPLPRLHAWERRIRAQLGQGPNAPLTLGSCPPPPRPPGMRQRRYRRLLAELAHVTRLRAQMFISDPGVVACLRQIDAAERELGERNQALDAADAASAAATGTAAGTDRKGHTP